MPIPNDSPTVFNRLQERGLPWKIYYDIENVMPLSLLAQVQLWPFFESNFFFMDQFWADAKRPNGLPTYAFIEPRFLLDHNDQHPGGYLTESVSNGERLVYQVYQAIRNGPNWNDTPLVITYDEHGGCYDHVAPPQATPPNPAGPPGQAGFQFDRYGVRVCTVLVSPLIEQGTVFRPLSATGLLPLDHNLLIETISKRWGLASLTKRDENAADISDALTVWPPRTDVASISVPLRMMAAPSLGQGEELSPFQRQFVAAAAAHMGAARTVGEAAAFLKDRAKIRGFSP